jgi:hypothetical protein
VNSVENASDWFYSRVMRAVIGMQMVWMPVAGEFEPLDPLEERRGTW